MTARIRKYQTDLIFSGYAVIAFGLWSIVRFGLLAYFGWDEIREGFFTVIAEADEPLPVTLVAGLAFSAAVDILRSVESRRYSGPWRLHICYGFLKVITAAACLFYLNSLKMVTFLYCIGLLHSAALRFITAFRRTAIVYVG